GPCITPYVRALKEERPVIVVRADARIASIYRYQFRAIEHVDTVRAYHHADHPLHMAAPPRQGFHTPTRGSTGHDAAQRSLLTGRDRMIATAVRRAHEIAGSDAWILVGGIPRVVARLTDELLEIAPGRVMPLDSLDVHSSDADMAAAARAGASVLRNRADRASLETIVELAGAHGLGAVGTDDAHIALEGACVRELYLTQQYRLDHAADAEGLVRAAIDQDAGVEEVSGSAADYLADQGGIAVSLRFRPATIEASVQM
ncbi:MAG: hypothetical protein ACREPM_12080, partial [Gemmatimonadaceae bacterium]